MAHSALSVKSENRNIYKGRGGICIFQACHTQQNLQKIILSPTIYKKSGHHRMRIRSYRHRLTNCEG